jgi:DNA-directed RNA polymerase subunit omega
LSTLIQKRLVQLNRGARPLVDTQLTDRMAIVLQEIEQEKIFLDMTNSVRTTGSPDFIDAPELDLDDL